MLPIFTGAQLCPKSFATRFKIVCREYLIFQKRIYKLGPDYLNCNEYRSGCSRQGADPFNGCLTCEYTIQRANFIKNTEKALEDYPRATWKGQNKWPFDDLLKAVIDTSNVAGSRKGTDPKWTMVVATLVSIYRSEDAKLRAAETHRPEESEAGPTRPTKGSPSNPYKLTNNAGKVRSALGPKLVDTDGGAYD